jgi:hypothetical protein
MILRKTPCSAPDAKEQVYRMLSQAWRAAKPGGKTPWSNKLGIDHLDDLMRIVAANVSIHTFDFRTAINIFFNRKDRRNISSAADYAN